MAAANVTATETLISQMQPPIATSWSDRRAGRAGASLCDLNGRPQAFSGLRRSTSSADHLERAADGTAAGTNPGSAAQCRQTVAFGIPHGRSRPAEIPESQGVSRQPARAPCGPGRACAREPVFCREGSPLLIVSICRHRGFHNYEKRQRFLSALYCIV